MRGLAVQRFDASEIAHSELLPLLACPACDDGEISFSPTHNSLVCAKCGTSFPVYRSGQASIPWLFSDPESTLFEWKARLNGFLQSNLSEQLRLKTALEDSRLGKLGRKRITHLLHATETQRTHVLELLEPLGLADDDATGTTQSLPSKLPKAQGLSSYYNNIFRDWVWNNGENEELFDAVQSALNANGEDGFRKVLTLGAGACRLSYDLHREYSPELSVVLDINPMLFFLASRIIHGETVPFYEFPIAPLNQASFAVLQDCCAPEPIDYSATNFRFLFADAMNPPFKPASFDTVLTPWLIDIIPQDLREFIPRVNRLLRQGGIWLNTGSLAFFHKDETWRYSEEEVLELVENTGFEILSAKRSKVRYLHSPHSAHGRMEEVLTICARKIENSASPPRYEYLPKWILESDQAIPDLFEFSFASTDHLLHAQVLAAIDGKRTIDEIGSLVAKQYGLQDSEAAHAVQRILIELYEDK